MKLHSGLHYMFFFVYNRSKISDLFILQFVYFASRKQFFHQFNLFYKLGPHSVHINKIKCISKMNCKDIQTGIINNVSKNVKVHPFCLSKVKVWLPVQYV